MESILWHRRETRRQTENTNRLLQGREAHGGKVRGANPCRGKGVGRWKREVKGDAAHRHRTFASASSG